MNKNDLKNPLIQSGALLLFVFLLISIVAGSETEGIGGSIGALFSGLFSAVLFIIALCIAIIVSIAVIIGIYIAAVSIYSVDRGRDLIEQLKNASSSALSRLSSLKKSPLVPARSDTAPPAAPSPEPASAAPVHRPPADLQFRSLQEKIDGFGKQLDQISRATAACEDQIATLRSTVDEFDTTADASAHIAAVEDRHHAVSAQIEDIAAKIDANRAALERLEKQFGERLDGLEAELAALEEKTSVPEMISGILSYIDTQEDRDTVTEKATEAIARNMTYSQIDDFFKETLPPGVYRELAAHPRLTKDFLRSIKKKF